MFKMLSTLQLIFGLPNCLYASSFFTLPQYHIFWQQDLQVHQVTCPGLCRLNQENQTFASQCLIPDAVLLDLSQCCHLNIIIISQGQGN